MSGSTSAGDAPQPLPKWAQQLMAELNDETVVKNEIPTSFLVTWGGLCTISLGAGVTVGYRGFENTAAFEALDKLEKPTAASEAMASRMAMRAFGWGTALAVGSAVAAAFAARALGIKSAADVGTSARSVLGCAARMRSVRFSAAASTNTKPSVSLA